jgi:hypothetical protein
MSNDAINSPWVRKVPSFMNRTVLILCLAVVSCGCTVDDKGICLGSRRYFENATHTGRSVVLEGWGIHVSTIVSDRGITIGAMQKSYYFPGLESRSSNAFPVREMATSDLLELRESRPFVWSGLVPMAERSSCMGLSAEAGSQRSGVSIGETKFSSLWLNKNANVLVLMKSGCRGHEPGIFHVREVLP